MAIASETCRLALGSCCGSELTVRDFERIRRESLYVRVSEFVRLWLTAERRGDPLTAAGRKAGDVAAAAMGVDLPSDPPALLPNCWLVCSAGGVARRVAGHEGEPSAG
ncbi:hypothetical protein ACIBL3_44485 [Kribbella sp. NPDC050124]|uniref:hypothetical protein n=1 Tax=Kribbella sp. NPDC050124 TaxID=3364114 RepID=UPI0037B4D247